MHRRQFLALGGLTIAISTAGCVDEVLDSIPGTGPDPVVLDSEANRGLLDGLTGSATIYILLRNEGSSGDVRVEVVQTRGDRTTVTDRTSRIFYLDEAEQRQVSIDISIATGTEAYRVEAEAA